MKLHKPSAEATIYIGALHRLSDMARDRRRSALRKEDVLKITERALSLGHEEAKRHRAVEERER